MSDPNDSTSTVSRSSTFLEFCENVRNNDPSVLPEPGEPLRIADLSEKEGMELADALLENTSVTYLELETESNRYKKLYVQAMAKYVRTSKSLQHISWKGGLGGGYRENIWILCCFLPAFQESMSLKKLDINFPPNIRAYSLAFEKMLTHTQTLRSLSLSCPNGTLEDRAVAAASSGLKKNITLREFTLEFSRGMNMSPPF